MRKYWLLCVAIASLQLGACATVIRGTTEPFDITTIPAGAKVVTNLETAASLELRKDALNIEPQFYVCEATPCTWELSRKSDFDLFVELDGYHPVHIKIDSTYGPAATITGTNLVASTAGATAVVITAFSTAAGGAQWLPAAAGAVGYSGFVGIGVDLASGAMKNVSPNPIELPMVPVSEPIPQLPEDSPVRYGITRQDYEAEQAEIKRQTEDAAKNPAS